MSRLERIPVRWRLALISAGLTFAILLLFALVVGIVTAREVRSSFDNEIRLTSDDLRSQVNVRPTFTGLHLEINNGLDQMLRAAAAGDAHVQIVSAGGVALTPNARDLGPPLPQLHDSHGYRVVSRPLSDPFGRTVAYLQYGKRLSSIHRTIRKVRLLLILGVVGGTALALLAGLGLARRAMAPIVNLTRAAKDIARTRDPAVHMPQPAADDEVADLARTLEQMLMALDAARSETQAALERQREFVADASHELRTPLTSILANLELLEAELSGEDAEIAGSALRSSRRMRRLVADLLLLARADAGRPSRRETVDLGATVREAVAEAAPIAEGHDLSVEVADGLTLEGSPDELHRLVLNLIQNAVVHTPPGTGVSVGAARPDGASIELVVADDGPGIAPDLRERIFDRFVRGDGDRARTGSGLGLSIVRAVAEAHGGSVSVGGGDQGGARFVVRLPAEPVPTPLPERVAAG